MTRKISATGRREFGDLMRDYRAAAKLTQMELAQRTGVTRDYIASIESGRTGVVYPDVFTRLQRELQFPGWVMLEAMGYETGLGSREAPSDVAGVGPELVAAVAELTFEQQRAMFDLLMATRRLGATMGTDHGRSGE